MYKTVL
jgi:hypothetical protein